MSQGRVIILNGTSSSGKTTIANLLHGMMAGPCLRTGIDDYLDRVGRHWIEVSDGASPETAPGWLALVRDGRLIEVRTGPIGLRILTAMYVSIAAAARVGIDVVVDDVIHEASVLRAAVTHLWELPVAFVGIKCALEIAEQRERERADRLLGGARAFHEVVHAGATYDLEVDSGRNSAEECAARIHAFVAAPRAIEGSAFSRMHEHHRPEST